MHELEKTTDAAERVGKIFEKPDCEIRIKAEGTIWNY